MDLIYTDEEFRDIGVLQGYTLDMAYGLDENDFVLRTDLHKPEIPAGGYIYVEGTEYGGIIDGIEADTISNQLSYNGRTWHGLLESRVIEPPAGSDYYTVQGEANSVVAQIIEDCELDDIFEVDSGDSGLYVDEYEFRDPRYCDVNYGLFNMLKANDLKLKISCYNGKVHLSVERLMNYAAAEELDSSQVQFTLKQTYAACNHLICLGTGQLKDRYVIHLFTDEGGGIRPYALDENDDPLWDPWKDEQYILDKSMQVKQYERDGVMVPLPEYAEAYDYRDAETIENYELLTTKPDDWDVRRFLQPYKGYTNYYVRSEDEDENDTDYQQITPNIQDVYSLTTSKPSDWRTKNGEGKYYTRTSVDPDTGEEEFEEFEFPKITRHMTVRQKPSNWNKVYMNYYVQLDGGTFRKIEKIPKYTRLTSKPDDWKKKYGNYYLRDGQGNYSPVPSDSEDYYKEMTTKPSGWANDWKSYYIKRRVSGKVRYVLLEDDTTLGRRSTAPKWQAKTFYEKTSRSVTPKWDPNVIYFSKTMVIPKYEDLVEEYEGVWYKTEIYDVCEWQADTYYTREDDVDIGVPFEPNCYYKKVLDHYYTMVMDGIKVLADLNVSDELSVTLKDSDKQYDIGDMIGGVEEITGIYMVQPIDKKIVKIENDVVTVEHQVMGVLQWQ